MLYDLKKNMDTERFKRRSEQLLKEGVVVELKKKVKRSTSQNSYLHLILGWFAMETGYTLAEAKQIYKYNTSGIYSYKKDGIEFIRSSADLSTTEMTSTIEIFRNYSSKVAGVYLPEPSDLAFLTEIEIELSRNKFV